MSRPGDKGREVITITDPTQVIVTCVELVGQRGGKTFEIAYDCPDRELADDEEPTASDRVRWRATAVIRRKLGKGRPFEQTYVGESIVEPGGVSSHQVSGALAAVDLMEKLGVNVVVLDQTTDADPRQGDGS